jgi:transposase
MHGCRLLAAGGRAGWPWRDHRQVLGGIIWKLHTGRPWRDVPERFGPWQTCYSRLRRWQRDGTWPRVWAVLAAGEHRSRHDRRGQALGAAAPVAAPGAGLVRRHRDHHSTCRTLGGVHHTSLVSSRCASAVEIPTRSDLGGLGGCGSSARSAAPRARPGGTGGLGADRRQERQGDHRQGDVPIPGVIAADLVVSRPTWSLVAHPDPPRPPRRRPRKRCGSQRRLPAPARGRSGRPSPG